MSATVQEVSASAQNVAATVEEQTAAIEEVRQRLAATNAQVVGIDGVRVTTEDGWWLLRASNTQDVLVARAESHTPEGLERLLAQIDGQLAASGLARGPQAGH